MKLRYNDHGYGYNEFTSITNMWEILLHKFSWLGAIQMCDTLGGDNKVSH